MKAAGILLLFAGFAIVMGALILLSTNALRGEFVFAGIVVQVLGLILTFRSHLALDEGH
jgi:hypothetical protein